MSKITIIVPIYKVEKYLKRCVDSIFTQTYKNYNCVLVDDGSPDFSGEMCDEFLLRDERFVAIHQLNRGLSAARNSGIDWSFACGENEWLAFVDSDDWIHHQMYDGLIKVAEISNMKIVSCGYLSAKSKIGEDRMVNYKYTIKTGEQYFFTKNNVEAIVAWNKIYKKELFNELRYPNGKINEDEFLTYKLLDRAVNVAVLDAVFYYYFQNPDGIMHSDFSIKKLDAILAIKEQYRFIKERKNKEASEIWWKKIIALYANFALEAKNTPYFKRIRRNGRKSLIIGIIKYQIRYRDHKDWYELFFPTIPRLKNAQSILKNKGLKALFEYYFKC